jgi:hypothetical protein
MATLDDSIKLVKVYRFLMKQRTWSLNHGYLEKGIGLDDESEYYLTDKAKNDIGLQRVALDERHAAESGVQHLTDASKADKPKQNLYDDNQIAIFKTGFLFSF